MRCYSEEEIKRIVEQEPIPLHRTEFTPVMDTDPAIDRGSLEVLQLAVDLEFEMKFEMLMRSIAHRLRHL